MLETGKWYTIMLLALSDPAWAAFDPNTVRLQPALLECMRSSSPTLVYCVTGDVDNALLQLADGPNDQREQNLPQTVVATPVEITHTIIPMDDGLSLSVVKLADDSSAFYINFVVRRLSTASTAALVTALS